MLLELFPGLRENKFIQKARTLFVSNVYIAFIAALMAISELFALEMPVYYAYILLSVGALLLCDDALPLVPAACCGYMTVSTYNNPARHPETSIFSSTACLAQMIVLLALIASAMILKLITAIKNNPTKKIPSLSFGFLALGIAYVLGGVFSGFYSGRTAFYGLVQILSLCVFYFFFYYTVKWNKASKEYMLKVMFAIGVGLALQIVGLYFNEGVFTPDGSIARHYLYTGWGIHNNVGGMMAMCIPAPLYFAATKKYGFLSLIVSFLFFFMVVCTQSRGSMLFGAIILAIGVVYALIVSKGKEKRNHLIVCGVVVVLAIVAMIVVWDKLNLLFASIFSLGNLWGGNGRTEIYQSAIEHFKVSPFFGVGFYECDALITGNLSPDEVTFLAARYHNTILQLLASGGVFALLCYAFHRVQTVMLVIKRRSHQTAFLGFCILALLLTSMLDCHFFNFGPGLIYSILLVFIERGDEGEMQA